MIMNYNGIDFDTYFKHYPDENGFYGRYGGCYITEDLKKAMNAVKGKDKVILTFMFLFPFFPDDILCFVAGITTMSKTFFIVMIILTRIISVFASSYSMNNSIIPYDTWWGILVWILFFAFAFAVMVVLYKKGDKIESKFFTKKKKSSK